MKTKIGLLGRHDKEIAGVLGCFDRLVVTGTLTEIAHPDAMDARIFREGFRAVEIGKFAEPLRQRLRDNAVELAREAGVEIDYLPRTRGIRKEDLVARVLARRGTHPGLVHVISVVESCATFKLAHCQPPLFPSASSAVAQPEDKLAGSQDADRRRRFAVSHAINTVGGGLGLVHQRLVCAATPHLSATRRPRRLTRLKVG